MSAARERRTIQPGGTIGVLGSGQLGRMFAIAARQMGYRVHTFSPDDDTPTGQVADVEVQAAYEDIDAVQAFARHVDVVTFEFENIPSVTAEAAARYAPVRPGGAVLATTQHRLREKTFLQSRGFPVTPFRAVRSAEQLHAALVELKTPAVLKTAGWGYDGKGQIKITAADQATSAWQALASDEAVLEAFVDFHCEASVVAARGLDGRIVDFGVIVNDHHHHILDVSMAPGPVSLAVDREARQIAHAVLEQLEVAGVLCVEFFVTRAGRLMINELAPRPHNSGHLTIDACVTSQFEQQVRAICALPLGSCELLRPAAMANLLGERWSGGTPDWTAALHRAEVKLHLYGKHDARPGRKMGHLTALADSATAARDIVLAARDALSPPTLAAATINLASQT